MAFLPYQINHIVPVVNLNGTSKEELIAQQIAVMEAANALETALRNAYPHGRDYQTIIGYNALSSAQGVYNHLIGTVRSIGTEASNLAVAIQFQGE